MKKILKALSGEKSKEQLDRSNNNIDPSIYLNQMTYKKFDESVAKLHYYNILKRKNEISKKLGKEVDFIVAAADYCSEEKLFDDMRLVEKQLVDELSAVAIYDGLTGLYKREVFDSLLVKEIMKRNRLEKPLSLVLIDIDDFKNINDTYGHIEGDEVLKTIGNLVTQNSRLYDIECRYGGEEIAIIIPESKPEEVFRFSERLRKIVNRTFKKKPYNITISSGIAYLSDEDDSLSLLRKADDALYNAKNNGKNQTCIFKQ